MKTTQKSDENEFDADDLNLISLAKEYSDEDKAIALFESMRWPGGKAICPHCKHDEAYKLTSKPTTTGRNVIRKGVYCCSACRKTFTAKVGTVMEASHIPVSTWMMALFLICSSKKSISAHQLHRMLKITYKSAWFLAHRIRFAFSDDGVKLTGTVEADETFVGGKGDIKTSFLRKTPVVVLLERGGRAKTRVVSNVSQHNLGKVLNECVDKSATVNTDEHAGYKPALKEFARHDTVNHSKDEYHRVNEDGTVSTTNGAESFFSLLKRGVYGSWHHVSREHLPKYSNEFAFRWSNSKITDGARMKVVAVLMASSVTRISINLSSKNFCKKSERSHSQPRLTKYAAARLITDHFNIFNISTLKAFQSCAKLHRVSLPRKILGLLFPLLFGLFVETFSCL